MVSPGQAVRGQRSIWLRWEVKTGNGGSWPFFWSMHELSTQLGFSFCWHKWKICSCFQRIRGWKGFGGNRTKGVFQSMLLGKTSNPGYWWTAGGLNRVSTCWGCAEITEEPLDRFYLDFHLSLMWDLWDSRIIASSNVSCVEL